MSAQNIKLSRFLVPSISALLLVVGMFSPVRAWAACGDPTYTSWLGGSAIPPRSNAQWEASPTGYSCGVTGIYSSTGSAANGHVPQNGDGWQCAEFAERFYATEGWKAWGGWGLVGAADIYTNATSLGFTRIADGSINHITDIVPGDMLVTHEETYGHVFVVDSVNSTANTISVVDQNGGDGGHTTVNYDPNTKKLSQGNGKYFVFSGVVHSPNDTLTNTESLSNKVSNVAFDGDFQEGTTGWTANSGTNFIAYASNQQGPESYYTPYSGANYASTNTGSGGSFYQDVSLGNAPAGTTYCANAQVRTSAGGSGAGGVFKLFLLGGTGQDGEGVSFDSLTDQWQPVETCVTATTAQTTLQISFYPTNNGPTLDVDDVDAHQSLAANGDFQNGTSGWSVDAGTNFVPYASNQLGPEPYFTPYSGANYAATNTGSGGSFYQDVSVGNVAAGTTYCASAQVRSSGGGSGAGGTMKLFLLGGTGQDGEGITFGSLTDQWEPIETCVTATSARTTLQMSFYPANNGPTLDVDDVDANQSLAFDGDFQEGTTGWTANAGTNFIAYASNQNGPEPYYTPYSGANYASTNTGASGGFYQDVSVGNVPVGTTYCASAQVRSSDGGSGAGGTMKLFLLGGTGQDGEGITFGSLSDQWQSVETCVTATSARTTLRIQVYPTNNGPTLDVDDVNVN